MPLIFSKFCNYILSMRTANNKSCCRCCCGWITAYFSNDFLTKQKIWCIWPFEFFHIHNLRFDWATWIVIAASCQSLSLIICQSECPSMWIFWHLSIPKIFAVKSYDQNFLSLKYSIETYVWHCLFFRKSKQSKILGSG